MALDTLILGGLFFDNFSPPESIPFGGKQAMAVHRLPGGSRVIDLLGPDDHDWTWNGFFWGDSAYAKARQLDAMRSAGVPVPLIWGGNSWLVVVSDVTLEVCRFPIYVHYSVTVVVASNTMRGAPGIFTPGIDVLLRADMDTAMSLVGL